MVDQTTDEYAALEFEHVEERPPFKFKIGEGEGRRAWEEKFELPALDDPGLPVELLDVALIAISGKSDDEQGREAFVVFTRWIREARPEIARALNRHSQTAPVLMALIEQWAKHSGATPKA